MALSGAKKSPLISVPYLKKRLRRITAVGLSNLTVNDFNFSVHFTLHRNENTVAFYTSEPVENQGNPEWSYLKVPPSVQCLQEFIMRVWITSSDHCRLLLEYDIHLDSSLVPDEQKKTVEKGNNTLWLEMFGYRFTATDDDDNDTEGKPAVFTPEEIVTLERKKRLLTLKSYNKLSIRRMNNVIHAIRSERQLSATHLQRLQTFFDAHEEYLAKTKERETRQLRVETLRKYLHFQTSVYQQRTISCQQRRMILEERKNQLNAKQSQLLVEQDEIKSYYHYQSQSRAILRQLTQIIAFRQREVMSDIYRYIYSIHCNANKEYFITNIKLPQADDKVYQSASNRDRDHEIAAAVGYCAHVVLIIAQFLQLPLRFPIDFHGTAPFKIYDYGIEPSEFPLHPTSNLSSFRYGFYLLNRNIGQIMFHCRTGDRTTDFRNTLENLQQIIEQYFINPSTLQSQIPLYPSLQTTIDEDIGENKRNSTAASLASSSFSSSSSSLNDNDAYEQNDDMDLFPQLTSIKPRLAMQISHQLHY